MGARASLLCMDFRSGRHFLQIPGPTNVPDRVLRAIDAPTIDHRGPAFAELGLELLGGLKHVFATEQPGRRLPVLGHGRVGGGAGQHAVPGRQGARVRDRALRHAVAGDGRAARPRGGLDPGRLAPRRRPRARRGGPARRPRRPRGDGRPQRDVDGRHEPGGGGPRGDRRRGLGRAAARRHDLLARVDRLPPRRVGRRRHGRLLAEGADAARRARVQRGRREGARRERRRAAAALLLGLEADPRGQPRRLLALHVGHEPALRPARGARHAARGGAARRLRAPPPARGGDAERRRGVGPRGAVRRPARAFRGADRGARARRPRRRRGAARDPRALRHVARRRPGQAAGPGVPDRPPRRLQRPDAGRDAVRRGDGPADRRRARAARRGRRRAWRRSRPSRWAAGRIALDADPARVRQAAAEPAA